MPTFMRYIEKIKENSMGEFVVRGKPTVKIGNKYVYFWRGEQGEPLDGLQFIEYPSIFWTYSSPQSFFDNYVSGERDLRLIVHSKRLYGEPKLPKPIELRGVKQAFSVDYIPKKARCGIFVNGDDIWIKHPDYFSASLHGTGDELGAPLGYLAEKYVGKGRKNKFVYGDAWGSVVLRNEAWLRIDNLLYWLRKGRHLLDLLDDTIRQLESAENFEPYSLVSTDMERFFENVLGELTNWKAVTV